MEERGAIALGPELGGGTPRKLSVQDQTGWRVGSQRSRWGRCFAQCWKPRGLCSLREAGGRVVRLSKLVTEGVEVSGLLGEGRRRPGGDMQGSSQKTDSLQEG